MPELNTVEAIFEYAMNEEKDASRFYLEAAKNADDLELKQFLVGLAKMEDHHYQVLKNKLDESKANHFCIDGILSSFHEELPA